MLRFPLAGIDVELGLQCGAMHSDYDTTIMMRVTAKGRRHPNSYT